MSQKGDLVFLCPAIGAIFSATDTVCTLQVLNQDETPLLYSLVFGEGVLNDATSIVLFNATQKFDLSYKFKNFLVDIKGPTVAFLLVLAFEGVTRHNIPKFEILKQDPDYLEALIGRGTSYAFQRELEAAIADFTKAVQADPSASEARHGNEEDKRGLL